MNRDDRNYVTSTSPWAAVDYVRKPTPLLGQVFIFFSVTFIVAALVYSANTMITVSVDTVGKFNSEIAPVPVKSPTQFTVGKINIKENQKVKKGEVLFLSTQTMPEEDLKVLKDYIAKMSGIVRENMPGCITCKARLIESTQAYTRIKAQGQLQSSLSPLQNQSVELTAALEESEGLPLVVADLRRALNVAKGKIAEIKKRKAENLLATELENLNQEVVSHQTKINDRYQRNSFRIKTAKDNISSRLAELNNMIEYLGQVQTINAPSDGVVTKLTVKGEGEFLQAGQVLFELVPIESKLIAELDLQNKDISKVKVGQKVKVTIDALPDYEYGSVEGEVIEITRKVSEGPQQPQVPGQSPATFMLKVKMSQQSLVKNGVENPFILGMTVKGHIIVNHESLLSSIYRMIFRIKDEAKMT